MVSNDPSNGDSSRLSDDEFLERFGIPRQESYTCLACGKAAYPPDDEIDTLDPEAALIQFLGDSQDPVIVCSECARTDDWEQRARERQSGQDSMSVWNRALSTISTTTKRLKLSLTQSWRNVLTDSDDEPQSAGPVQSADSSSLARSNSEKLEWKLEQEREWSDYLERELQTKEDRLHEVEQELHQLRQEVERDSDGPNDSTIDPHSSLLTTIFDVRESLANATAEAEPDSEFRDGLIRIDQQLADALNQQGIQRIDTSGEANPHRHKVIETVPTADHPPGTILEEYRAGYQRGGTVLRPAHVAVAVDSNNGDGPKDGPGDDHAGDEAR